MSLDQIKDLCAEAERYYNSGDFTSGLRVIEQALSLCEPPQPEPARARAPARARSHSAAMCYVAKAWLLKALNRSAEASLAMNQAILWSRSPDTELTDPERALVVLTQAADFAAAASDWQRASALWQEVLTLSGKHLGTDHPRYFQAVARLPNYRAPK